MLAWREKLRQGAVTCRVLHDGEIVEEFTPTAADQLWTSIVIRDLDETAKSYFAFEYEQFVESGKTAACYECEACQTIEKFGKAIQFKEAFMVEFEDTSRRELRSQELPVKSTETVCCQSQESTKTRLASCLTFCGAGHFVVDFACALTVVSLPSLAGIEDSSYYYLVILYNLLAFGSQTFWGWLIDRRASFRTGMTAGILLTGAGSAVAMPAPVAAVLLLGCGNALFHVGAGALVYDAAPGRASSQGVFVAPGGLGLLAGIMLGFRGVVHPLWLVPFLIGTALLLYRLVPVAETAALPEQKRVEGRWTLPTVLILLLSVVAIRSFTGFALPIPWKGVDNGVVFLAVSSFAGKASGGFLAERYGWRPLCGIMLIIAAAAGIGHNNYLLAACIGVFCLQTTTGVTLAGVQTLFPGRPAFAFGLSCIALLIGALPFFLPQPVGRIHPGLIAVICLCAVAAITVALTMRKKGVLLRCQDLKHAALH